LRAAALVLVLLASCSDGKAPKSEVLSQVGPFELVERSGAKITREDLLGRPWVASFLFTRCTGPCPKVAGTLRALQSRLGKSSARIVTFSVDPEWDTPQVLRQYAADLGADPKRWLFVTGDEGAIHELSRKGFLSAAERAPPGVAPIGEQVSHSTRLVAVDKKGQVRGYFAGESGEDLDRLVECLAALESERN
jgi:cytochrome oxidase Cu insertion factor (SCO1/SenC/PrrC family)